MLIHVEPKQINIAENKVLFLKTVPVKDKYYCFMQISHSVRYFRNYILYFCIQSLSIQTTTLVSAEYDHNLEYTQNNIFR